VAVSAYVVAVEAGLDVAPEKADLILSGIVVVTGHGYNESDHLSGLGPLKLIEAAKIREDVSIWFAHRSRALGEAGVHLWSPLPKPLCFDLLTMPHIF